LIREFRLSPSGSGRGISCDANGAFIGTIPPLKRSRANGKDDWEPGDCTPPDPTPKPSSPEQNSSPQTAPAPEEQVTPEQIPLDELPIIPE